MESFHSIWRWIFLPQLNAEFLSTPEAEMAVTLFEASRIELPGLADPLCDLRSFRPEGGSATQPYDS